MVQKQGNLFFKKRILGTIVLSLFGVVLMVGFGLKEFYFQYTAGEIIQFSTHFSKRVVQVEGAVFRNIIPGTTRGGETNFILVDDLNTPLSVKYRGDITPLLKSGEVVQVEGIMKGSFFIAKKVERLGIK